MVCIVRCLGGIAQTNQRYRKNDTATSETGEVEICWIERHGKRVAFIYRAHSARMAFSGDVYNTLAPGDELIEITKPRE